MAKLQKRPKIHTAVIWLFVAAIVIEVINIIYCVSVSPSQVNTCPRNPLPAQISQMLAIVSCLMVIIATFVTNRERLIVFFFTLFHILVVACLQLLLLSYANGGLNWCNVVF